MEPLSLDVSSEGIITISWSDGHAGKHSSTSLRGACPCAMCGGEPGVFGKYYEPAISKIDPKVQPDRIDSVGRYGLKIAWSDGHDLGIYTFEYLRKLCECEICLKHRKSIS